MRRAWLLVTAVVTWGCDLPAAPDGAPASEPTTHRTHGEVAGAQARRGAELAFRWRQVHGRLGEPMPRPESFDPQACPDGLRDKTPGAETHTLTLDFDDARYGAHSLMPLTMTRWLQSPHEQKLQELLDPESNPKSESFEFASQDAMLAAERLMGELDQRVYKGVFFVIQYKKPHLIRKKGNLRREWLPGLLQAWFAVFDIDTSQQLCATRLIVTSDVEDEPVWLRTKAQTQQKLIGELGQSMLGEAQRALSEMGPALSLEVSYETKRVASAVRPE